MSLEALIVFMCAAGAGITMAMYQQMMYMAMMFWYQLIVNNVLMGTAQGLLMLTNEPCFSRMIPASKQRKRIWSRRLLDPYTRHIMAKERSFGVWEALLDGKYHKLVARNHADIAEDYFLQLCRMDRASFSELFRRYGYRMERHDTRFRDAIPGPKRQAIFLTYLAHGDVQSQIAKLFDVSQPTVSNIISEGKQAFADMYQHEIVLPTSQHDVASIAAGFQAEAGLVGCCGAVDGTFFCVQAPAHFTTSYYCYDQFYAIIVLAVCDSNMLIRYVNAGEPVSAGDAAVWIGSKFKTALQAGMFDLLAPLGPATTCDGTAVSSYVVADTAFAVDSRVIKCYPAAVSEEEMRFNAAVIRTRRVVESCFEHLKGRWHVLEDNTIKDPDESADVAMLCCALHNFCERRRQSFQSKWSMPRTATSTAVRQAFEVAQRRFNNGRRAPSTKLGPAGGQALQAVLQKHISDVHRGFGR